MLLFRLQSVLNYYLFQKSLVMEYERNHRSLRSPVERIGIGKQFRSKRDICKFRGEFGAKHLKPLVESIVYMPPAGIEPATTP